MSNLEARIKALAVEANGDQQKFAQLIARECVDIIRNDWYRLNSIIPSVDETAREAGIRNGAKLQSVNLLHQLSEAFEL